MAAGLARRRRSSRSAASAVSGSLRIRRRTLSDSSLAGLGRSTWTPTLTVTPLPLAGGEQYAVGSYGRIGDPDNVYQANKADYKAVLPGYFEAMRIRLVSGRTFIRGDNEEQALDDTVDAALFGLKDRYAQCPCCLQTAPPGLRRDAEYRRQVRIWLSETHEED